MSKLEQLSSRPPTAILSTRCDHRYLATLVLFWRSQGELPKSISELVRLSLESFAEFITLSTEIEFVQKHTDALEILDNVGLRPDKMNPKNLAAAFAAEGATLSFLATPNIAPGHNETLASSSVSSDSPDLAVALAKMEEKQKESLASQIAEAQARTAEFKSHIGVPKEDSSNEKA